MFDGHLSLVTDAEPSLFCRYKLYFAQTYGLEGAFDPVKKSVGAVGVKLDKVSENPSFFLGFVKHVFVACVCYHL